MGFKIPYDTGSTKKKLRFLIQSPWSLEGKVIITFSNLYQINVKENQRPKQEKNSTSRPQLHGKLYFIEKSLNNPGKLLFDL
jgi:hypothetical protein